MSSPRREVVGRISWPVLGAIGEPPEPLLRQIAHGGEVTFHEDGPPAPVSRAARREGGKPYAIEVGMTADLLTRQASDGHTWKYAPLALGVGVPATAPANELPARRPPRVARTGCRITAGDF
ncbi:hypothetical protein [Streptomyces sp. NPDC090093]|uniref:hypothetical protein n=1 Tax=Streptomyces sp. NPDC090093 TaxID=3365945 RepID=UPI0037FF5491